jgi:stage II sporulation protein D
MKSRQIAILLLCFSFYSGFFLSVFASSEVKVRLLTYDHPDMVIITAGKGQYRITDSLDHSIVINENESVVASKFGNKIYLKPRSREGFVCDTIYFLSGTNSSSFSLRYGTENSSMKKYSGELKCFADMQKLILVNKVDIEKYLEGVVMAEGGGGKYEEYFKTQAVIARTYTFKYISKHDIDGYNLCDDTHCQAYDGIIKDSLIIKAVTGTRGQVIITTDSVLIISAFHSNCGGETSPSEYVWVTPQSYLKRVQDPYCRNSRNALWNRRFTLNEWGNMLKVNGFTGSLDDPGIFNFDQPQRMGDYKAGNYSVPLRNVRTRLNLRSTYFSVRVEGDSVYLAGKGYGHGVGLCQEGAINMAALGKSYQEIINFYYSGVHIIDIAYVKKVKEEN